MKLKQLGKYFDLPIGGLKIKEIVFIGMLKIVFDDNESSYLDFHSLFSVTQHGKVTQIDPRDKNALTLFYDHFNVPVKEAKADKHGQFVACV